MRKFHKVIQQKWASLPLCCSSDKYLKENFEQNRPYVYIFYFQFTFELQDCNSFPFQNQQEV